MQRTPGRPQSRRAREILQADDPLGRWRRAPPPPRRGAPSPRRSLPTTERGSSARIRSARSARARRRRPAGSSTFEPHPPSHESGICPPLLLRARAGAYVCCPSGQPRVARSPPGGSALARCGQWASPATASVPVRASSDRLLVDATSAPEGTAKDRLPRGACGRLRGSLRSTRLRTPRVGRCARRLRDPSFPSEDRLPGLLPCRPRTPPIASRGAFSEERASQRSEG
jgi:hypothetical protein